MNLIDRYVYAVAKYLPKDIRDDVSTELRTNIEDMLPEHYTEKDVYKVLEEMGSPMELANSYNPQKRYLIGPAYFDEYIKILKLVIGIFVVVSVGIGIIASLVNPVEQDLKGVIVELFTKVITGTFVGAIQGVFWVTIVFVILERSGIKARYPFNNEKWTPDSLPELPANDQLKISRGETVFTIICTIAVTALLYFQPQLIALYIIDESGTKNVFPLLDINRLQMYMIFILGFALLQLGLFVWKYNAERWNMSLIVCNAIYYVLASILVVVMLSDSTLFNAEFVSGIAEYTKGSRDAIETWFNRGKWIFTAFFIGICAWENIALFYKYGVKGNIQ